MDVREFQRIIILGNNGSGKSYLSEALSALTGLPLVHLDIEFWRPGWQAPSQEEWYRKNLELISKEKWILDGNCNHGGTIELRFKAADFVIFLDINRLVCLAGVLKRNGKKRSDTMQYLEEKYDLRFLHFCRGIWNFSKTRRRGILKLHTKYPDKPFFVIKSRRKMNQLVRQWCSDYRNPNQKKASV